MSNNIGGTCFFTQYLHPCKSLVNYVDIRQHHMIFSRNCIKFLIFINVSILLHIKNININNFEVLFFCILQTISYHPNKSLAWTPWPKRTFTWSIHPSWYFITWLKTRQLQMCNVQTISKCKWHNGHPHSKAHNPNIHDNFKKFFHQKNPLWINIWTSHSNYDKSFNFFFKKLTDISCLFT